MRPQLRLHHALPGLLIAALLAPRCAALPMRGGGMVGGGKNMKAVAQWFEKQRAEEQAAKESQGYASDSSDSLSAAGSTAPWRKYLDPPRREQLRAPPVWSSALPPPHPGSSRPASQLKRPPWLPTSQSFKNERPLSSRPAPSSGRAEQRPALGSRTASFKPSLPTRPPSLSTPSRNPTPKPVIQDTVDSNSPTSSALPYDHSFGRIGKYDRMIKFHTEDPPPGAPTNKTTRSTWRRRWRKDNPGQGDHKMPPWLRPKVNGLGEARNGKRKERIDSDDEAGMIVEAEKIYARKWLTNETQRIAEARQKGWAFAPRPGPMKQFTFEEAKKAVRANEAFRARQNAKRKVVKPESLEDTPTSSGGLSSDSEASEDFGRKRARLP